MSVQKPTQMTFTEPPYLGYNAPVKPKLNAPEVKANNEKAVSEAVQRLYQLQNEQQTRKQGIANNLLNMTAPTKKGRKK